MIFAGRKVSQQVKGGNRLKDALPKCRKLSMRATKTDLLHQISVNKSKRKKETRRTAAYLNSSKSCPRCRSLAVKGSVLTLHRQKCLCVRRTGALLHPTPSPLFNKTVLRLRFSSGDHTHFQQCVEV
ncbi:hypothetical protein HPB48_008773 [Haemaphysalis longicornis]|uniref:Uncharacterized protein n=1 Tax=Haemaphysalis longicornis TaxID=44386 RepID=A0A9J6GRD8_HAELO|nr:hypothetical protein HPB48_008773 [Haemaphysalis longicornis]